MTEAVVTTGAIRHAKLQSTGHHQQTNTQFLQAGCPSCRPTNIGGLKERASARKNIRRTRDLSNQHRASADHG